MKNLDLLNMKKAEIANRMNQAVKEGNEEAFQQAFNDFTDILQEAVLAEARGLVEANDNSILMGRGARVLTSKEREYYEKIIDAMKSSNPKQSISLIDETLPTTVIDAVLDDIVESHPLLSAINFQNTGLLTEILVSTLDGRFKATWGPICGEITKELSAGTAVINLRQKKLTAYIPVCKAMLEAGPTWLDRYVRTILAESIANGLEEAIIDGTGLNEPVGMRRNPNGALDPVTGYPLTVAVPLAEITPETYGGILAALSVGPTGLNRAISEVIFIVNPVDYFTKLMPATTQMVNGTWVKDIFPFPTRVIQSVHMPQGEAIIGLANRYFFGLGAGEGGRIEFSDHYHFLEDERMYITKLYGDGKPLDNVSFKRVDISALHPAHPVVRVADYIDARIEAMVQKTEKNATINLNFNKNIHAYTAEIEDVAAHGDNDTAALTITPVDDTATIVVKNGSSVVTPSDGVYSLSLTDGVNIITITCTVGTVSEAYVLVIEYTEIPQA